MLTIAHNVRRTLQGLLLSKRHGWRLSPQARKSQKAVLAALLTSLVKKACTPSQDVRLHKVEMIGGYSGRSFDTNHVTPFLSHKFPRLAMKSGSGWLTRSIEQNHPFDLQFPGKVQNTHVKMAFLHLLQDVEADTAPPERLLQLLFAFLLRKAEAAHIVVARTPNAGEVTIEAIVDALHTHFFAPYHGAGASRLPVLAIYAAYESLSQYARYTDKHLLPLKSHTTSDTKSSSVGDVEVARDNGSYFEAVEVKHNIPIAPQMVQDAFEKFQMMPLDRYYLLTTAEPNATDITAIRERTRAIRRDHGCEVIVNGIMPSLKYYLRLADDPVAFIRRYTEALRADFTANTDLKETHLEKWNELLSNLTPKET